MTFIDLVLKLLPFSYVENEEVHFSLWQQLTDGDKIITTIEILLMLIFIFFIFKLWKSFVLDKKQINDLIKILYKYDLKDTKIDSYEYNNFKIDIKKIGKELENIWNEFDGSLIKKQTKDGKFTISKSIDSDYFFNKSTLINHTGSKLFSSIPGILLSIGLLGTFFGLYVALIQLNVTDSQKLSESIRILINMAGVKFAASIWGLFLSILFTFFDKVFEFNLDKKLELIQKNINKMFIRETSEQNIDKILVENEQQTKALNGLATSLTEKISAEFNNILIPKINSINNHFENLPKNISSSIFESLEKPLQSISDTVTHITSNQVEQSTQVLETIIQKFIEKIDNITGDQGKILKDSALQSQKVLEDTSNHLDDTFKTIKEILQSQQNSAELRDKKIIEDLETMKTFQIGILKHVVKTVNSNLENLSSNITENMNTVNNHVGQNLEKLVISIEKVSEEQATNAFKREEMVAQKITKLMDELANSTIKQLESDKQRDEYRDKKIIEDLETMKTFQNEMFGHILSNVNSNIEKLSSKVGDNISNINNHMSTNLQQLVTYMEKIGEEQATNAFKREEMVAQKITKLMDELANSTTKQLESDKQRDEYIQNVIKNLENLVANLKNEITTIDDIFSKTSQKLSFIPTQIDKFSSSIEKLNNFENSQKQTTELLLDFGNKLGSTTDNLVPMIDNLHSYSQSFNETNKEFNKTIHDTKELFITMNTDFASLSEKNQEIVDNFSRNTERALNEYHKSVEDAIKSRVIPQLDKALSGYASTMAEAISSLSEAIDELRDKNI